MDHSVQSDARATMLGLISGFHISRALYIAARLKLADRVRDGAPSCTELAAQTGTNAVSLFRIVRVLASAGVFAVDEHEQVTLTPLAETLLSDHSGSLGPWAISQIGDDPYRAWGGLMHSVRTGCVAFDEVYGCDCWQYRAQHPESARDFDEGMVSFVTTHDKFIVESYPFAQFSTVVDIGGGEGKLLAALLAANARMKGVLFEQASVIEKARTRIADAGLSARCELIAGDFFGTLPRGGDVYLLSRVLHDWDDGRAITILRRCRAALSSTARLLLVERVVPASVKPTPSMQAIAVSDLHMMVMNGGLERTEAQYRALLDAAGLELSRVTPAGTVMSIIEARPCSW